MFVLVLIIFWFLFFLWEDRADPGPKKLMFLFFLIGFGVFALAGGIEAIFAQFLSPANPNFLELYDQTGNISTAVIMPIMLAGVVEETLKYTALREFLYRRLEFNQIADGVFYGVTMALGFVFLENTSYFIDLLSSNFRIFLSLIILRVLLTTLMHITTAGLIGLYLGKRKYSTYHKGILAVESLLGAMAIHMTFNFLTTLPYGILLMPLVILPPFIYILKQFKKPEVLAIWKIVDPRLGQINKP